MILEPKAQKLSKDILSGRSTQEAGQTEKYFFLVSFPTENKSRSFYFSTCL